MSRSVEQLRRESERSRAELAATVDHLRARISDTAEDIRQAAEESVHRFKPEPLLSKTGTGSLSSASTAERAKEVEHSMELTQKLEQRARRNGKRSGSKS